MTASQTFVIVGAGLAGAKAAQTLREEGFEGRVVLLGAERGHPYERPPLSKEHLRGEDASLYVHERDFYADHAIELRTGMEYSGHVTSWDEVVVRGDLAAREFIAFWLQDGRVQAGMNVNVWDVSDDIQALIRSRESVDRRRLEDPAVPLAELLPAAAREG